MHRAVQSILVRSCSSGISPTMTCACPASSEAPPASTAAPASPAEPDPSATASDRSSVPSVVPLASVMTVNYPICNGSCFVQTCGSSCRGLNRDIYRPRGGDVLAYSTPSSARLDQEKRSSLGKTYEPLVTLCPYSFRLRHSLLSFRQRISRVSPRPDALALGITSLVRAPHMRSKHTASPSCALPARCQRLMAELVLEVCSTSWQGKTVPVGRVAVEVRRLFSRPWSFLQ